LLSSHIFEEVERVCDRVGIIKDGYLIALEDIHTLKQKTADIFEVYLEAKDDNILKSGLDISYASDNIYRIAVKNNYKEFFKLMQEFKVTKIVSFNESLEDLFMKHYGDD
jgi:ABC-2 type transport system ATP-binding protein